MRKSICIILNFSVLLKAFFQSKGMLTNKKPPVQSSRNSVDGGSKLLIIKSPERKVAKKKHEARFITSKNNNILKGKASKQAKIDTANSPASLAPSISSHPTPIYYLIDDDSYYNRTTAPTKSSVNPSNQIIATPMPTATLLPIITQTYFPTNTSLETTANFSASLTQSVSSVNSFTSAPTHTASIIPSAIPSQASSEYPSAAPSLFPTFHPSATPTKPFSIAARSYSLLLPSFLIKLTFNSSRVNLGSENVSNITGQFLEQNGFRRKYGLNFTSLDLVAEQLSQSEQRQDNVAYTFECSGVASFVNFIPKKSEVDSLLHRSLHKRNFLNFFGKNVVKLSPQNYLTNLTVEVRYYKSHAPSEKIYATNITNTFDTDDSMYAYVAGALAAIIFSITSVVAFLRWRDSRKPLEYHDATNNFTSGEPQLQRFYPDEILFNGKNSGCVMRGTSDGISSINNGSRNDDGSSINNGSTRQDVVESCFSDYAFDKPNEFFLYTPATEDHLTPEFKFDLMPNESLLCPPASENSYVPDFTYDERSLESPHTPYSSQSKADSAEKLVSNAAENESKIVDVCLDANNLFPSPERASSTNVSSNIMAFEDNSIRQFSLSSMLMRNSISTCSSSNMDGCDKVLNNITTFVNASNPSLNNNKGSVAKILKRSLGILDDKSKFLHKIMLQDDASSLSGATIDERFYFAPENLKQKETDTGGFMYV